MKEYLISFILVITMILIDKLLLVTVQFFILKLDSNITISYGNFCHYKKKKLKMKLIWKIGLI